MKSENPSKNSKVNIVNTIKIFKNRIFFGSVTNIHEKFMKIHEKKNS